MISTEERDRRRSLLIARMPRSRSDRPVTWAAFDPATDQWDIVDSPDDMPSGGSLVEIESAPVTFRVVDAP